MMMYVHIVLIKARYKKVGIGSGSQHVLTLYLFVISNSLCYHLLTTDILWHGRETHSTTNNI